MRYRLALVQASSVVRAFAIHGVFQGRAVSDVVLVPPYEGMSVASVQAFGRVERVEDVTPRDEPTGADTVAEVQRRTGLPRALVKHANLGLPRGMGSLAETLAPPAPLGPSQDCAHYFDRRARARAKAARRARRKNRSRK